MHNVDILVIDGSQLFREGLKPLLVDADFTVLGEAESIDAALGQLGAGLVPRIVLVDFDEAKVDLSALGRVREKVPTVKLVVLAGGADDVHSLALCFEAGVDAYLLKTISPDVLVQSLKLVLLGEKVFPTRLAALLIQGAVPRSAAASADLDGLSSRENQILRGLLSGHPNKVIARDLAITEATVKVHLKGLMKKIHTENRTQAAIWALNHGLASHNTDRSLPGYQEYRRPDLG